MCWVQRRNDKVELHGYGLEKWWFYDIYEWWKKSEYHIKEEWKWNITIVDTGNETMSGGRLKQVREIFWLHKIMRESTMHHC